MAEQNIKSENQVTKLHNEPINVHALLVVRKINQRDICERFHFHQSEVSKVIRGKRRNKNIRKAIAGLLGMSVEDLWPTKGRSL